MAITKENLELFREEKLQEKKNLVDEKNEAYQELERKVSDYKFSLTNEWENTYKNKFSAIDAQVEVLDDLIVKADKLEEIV